jgi:hypothetical protein
MSRKALAHQCQPQKPTSYLRAQSSISFESQHFHEHNKYQSIEHVQKLMHNYMDTGHYVFKQCLTKRKGELKVATFICTRHNTRVACNFKIKFAHSRLDNSMWHIYEAKNLSHNHPPLIDKIFQIKKRNVLTIMENMMLNILLWKSTCTESYAAPEIKKEMDGKFPEHGGFNIIKIESKRRRISHQAQLKIVQNPEFSHERHVASLMAAYSNKYLTLETRDSGDIINHAEQQVGIAADMTPINKLTLSFDDISSSSFKWDSLPN